MLTSDVPLRCLDRSVTKKELNLFELAATFVAESGTGTTKVVGRQIGDAGLTSRQLLVGFPVLKPF